MSSVISAADYRALTKPRRANKFGAKRVDGATRADGKSFHSGLEAEQYDHLRIRERLGEIRVGSIKTQVRFHLVVNGVHVCDYVADFTYELPDGEARVVDAKGYATPDFKIKAKLMKACFGIDVICVGKAKTKPPRPVRRARRSKST